MLALEQRLVVVASASESWYCFDCAAANFLSALVSTFSVKDIASTIKRHNRLGVTGTDGSRRKRYVYSTLISLKRSCNKRRIDNECLNAKPSVQISGSQ